MLIEDERVGIVVHHDDAVALGETHEPLVGLHPCIAASRHVGIVGPHQADAAEVHALQLVKVGLPPIVLAQVVVDDAGSKYFAQ